jgi:diguanylate cyclase (GGDEF)-like protein/PAS domain S-box-containing protein
MWSSFSVPLTPQRRQLAEWLLLAAILSGSALMGAYFSWSEQRLTEETEITRMDTQTRLVDDNLRTQMAGLRSALASVRDAVASQPRDCRTTCGALALKALKGAMPGVRALLVVDGGGNVRAGHDTYYTNHVGDGNLVQNLNRMHDPGRVYLLRPKEPALPAGDIYASMPVPAPSGGAVVAILGPDYFNAVMRPVLYAPDMRGAITEENGMRDPSPTTRDGRIIVQRSIAPINTALDRTLVVTVSRNLDHLLGPTRHLTYVAGIGWLLLALGSVTALLGIQRRRLAQREWSEHRLAERAAEAQRVEMALDGSGLGLWEWELARHRTHLDARAAAMIGYTSEQADSDTDWMQGVHPDDRASVERSLALHLDGRQPTFEVEYRQRHANGCWVWLHSRGKVVERGAGGEPRRMVGTRQDISVRKNAETEIEHLAFYDSLTDLPNRRLLHDRLRQALANSERGGRVGAVLFIDLDNFKDLNDTLGHDMGDRLLQQVASRLRLMTREADTVARLGGDEFVVLLENLDNTGGCARRHAELVAGKIIQALSAAYYLEGHELHSTPSIGIALYGDQQYQTVDELLKQADVAMYDAKAEGRNRFRFFSPLMQAAVAEQAALENDLRHAVQRAELFLCFQPIVDNGGRMTCAEALVRWQHPVRGLVVPADFIPVAERSALILAIGDWVLTQACVQLAQWAREMPGRSVQIAVNVSARQFSQDDFVDKVLRALQLSGADPRHLKVELTESVLLHDVEEVIAKMTSLKARGVCFALDDFGTGYSSLSYLQRLPLDQLKIDKSFVHCMLDSQNAATIVCAIVALAESLDMDVVAEGVETEAQRQFLRECGCRNYQGYLIGKPVPAEKLVRERGILRQGHFIEEA